MSGNFKLDRQKKHGPEFYLGGSEILFPKFCFKLFSLLTLVTGLINVSSAQARDLQGRLGLGYNDEFANSLTENATPGVSLKYAFAKDIAGAVIFGVSTASPTNTVTAAKIFKNLFLETNLNFYFFVGAGLVHGGGNTGTDLLSGLGTEFFIPGLESLGFSVETGASLNNLSGSFALRTLGISFLNAGIHFYF